MKCPYCDYEYGWNGDVMKIIHGEEGDFYRVSNGIQMVQQVPQYYYSNNVKELYGCPSCNKIFMD